MTRILFGQLSSPSVASYLLVRKITSLGYTAMKIFLFALEGFLAWHL